jgi:Acyl-coenzyme A:6-aminopenicillanic acid acyl-transferase
MTLRHIEAAGDPFELGVAIGREGSRSFREVVRTLARYRALQSWRGSERLAGIEVCSRRAFPDLMREIDGIAEGVGAPFEDIFLWNCRGDLPGNTGFTGAQGCTDVLIPGDAAAGLPAVIGHNEDDAGALAGHGFLVAARPAGGLAFTSFCGPGLLPGHTFAVNEAGLVQTINHIRPRDQTAGVGRHVIARAVLGCRDVAAALGLLERRDRAAGFHHNLGMRGDARLWSVEAPASGCVAIVAERPRAHANHLVFDAFAGLDQEIAASSRDRQARADALIAAGTLARDPLAVLRDTAGGDFPICRKMTGGKDTGYTLATAVFEISPKAVAWRVYDDPAAAPVREGQGVRPSS